MDLFLSLTIVATVSIMLLRKKVPSIWRALKPILIPLVLGIWMFSAISFTVDFLGSWSFFKAVNMGDVEHVDNLLSKRPLLIHARTFFKKETGLLVAARIGKEDMVDLLVKSGSDVDVKDLSGIAPLGEASFNGDIIVARILIMAGADVNTVGGRHKSTPLHTAAYRGHVGVLKLLLAHGARADVLDSLGRSPLQLAQENRKTNVIAVLMYLLPKQ
jgi:ankyrin repeat protein